MTTQRLATGSLVVRPSVPSWIVLCWGMFSTFDRHIVGAFKEGDLAIHARGPDLGEPLRHVALHVARYHLAQRPIAQRGLPDAPMPLEVHVAPKRPLDAGEVVADEVRQEDVAATDALGEEAPLLHLRLSPGVEA